MQQLKKRIYEVRYKCVKRRIHYFKVNQSVSRVFIPFYRTKKIGRLLGVESKPSLYSALWP
jgi:hypothetical protein